MTHEELVEECARKSFEVWAQHNGRDCGFEDMPDYELDFALEMQRAILALIVERVKEPTEAMLIAFGDANEPHNSHVVRARSWSAMLAASPLVEKKK